MFDNLSLFDMFDNTEEKPNEEPKVIKKNDEIAIEDNLSEVELSDTSDDTISDSDEDEIETATTLQRTTKNAKDTKTIECPVKVCGTGWSLSYGENGVKNKISSIVKAVFDMGYTEMAFASLSYSGNTIFVDAISKVPTSDDMQMGKELTVGLGNFKVKYSSDMFVGMDEKEISIFDVLLAFQKQYPDFKGCGLHVNYGAKFAVPTFSKKVKISKEKTYKVWSENGVSEVAGEILTDATYFKSDSGVLFPVPGKEKSKPITAVKLVENVQAQKAVELYHLPFTLWIETFGTKKACSSDDFGGKSAVDKKDIINLLKGSYRAFNSSNRKFSINYDRDSAVVGVAIISGEKGGV